MWQEGLVQNSDYNPKILRWALTIRWVSIIIDRSYNE